MEAAVSRANLIAALKRVERNGGAPGPDGMRTDELRAYLKVEWPRLREQLLAGGYRPQPVRRVEIEKPGGGMRQLGIPTVLDRFIQQALLQVLQPRIDPTFSEASFGFRPGRRAHDAVQLARRYVQEGRRVVVDVDLAQFFDRVNHDILMSRVARHVADRRVLGLIRRYLEAGVMIGGVIQRRDEGTPQGGPLSPLLANILLDEVDKDLERRGHAFVRYADDANVYVRSRRAGERVMRWLEARYARLHLSINAAKSAVAAATTRKFLGYALWVAPGRRVKLRVADAAQRKLRRRISVMTRASRGRSLVQVVHELRPYLLGWREYFSLAESPRTMRELDRWIRHRLRALQLRHWRHPLTIYRELRALGLEESRARAAGGCYRSKWRTAGSEPMNYALPVRFFDELGVPRLAA